MSIKYFILGFIVMFGVFCLSGCKLTEDQKARISAAQAENVVLVKELAALKKKFEAGTLSSKEMMDAVNKVQSSISDNLKVINDIENEGNEVSKTEVIAFSVANFLWTMFGRGLPSKGPLSFIRSITGGSVRKE